MRDRGSTRPIPARHNPARQWEHEHGYLVRVPWTLRIHPDHGRMRSVFNDDPDLDARVLWHNLPATMLPGQSGTYEVVVRNEGDISWTGAAGFGFGELDELPIQPRHVCNRRRD